MFQFEHATLLKNYDPIPAGTGVVIAWAGSGMIVWWAAERLLLRGLPLLYTDFSGRRVATQDEKPGYLFWFYVPGFAYHGHHLYFDDWWLNQVYSWEREQMTSEYVGPTLQKLREVVRLCGREPADFPYPQAFCEWFAAAYPAGGCFWDHLIQSPRIS